MGGRGAAPFTRIAEDCIRQSWTLIEEARMPRTVRMLRDPGKMTVAEAQAWYSHIYAGQIGELPPSSIFQFAVVSGQDGKEIACYSHLCDRPHPKAHIDWLPQQKLYAQGLEQNTTHQAPKTTDWNGLPVARTVGVFNPWALADLQCLRPLRASNQAIDNLVNSIVKIEELGPTHVRDPQLMHAETNDHKGTSPYNSCMSSAPKRPCTG